jgi:hypothetical protein
MLLVHVSCVFRYVVLLTSCLGVCLHLTGSVTALHVIVKDFFFLNVYLSALDFEVSVLITHNLSLVIRQSFVLF